MRAYQSCICRIRHVNPCSRQASNACNRKDHIILIQDRDRLQYVVPRRQDADRSMKWVVCAASLHCEVLKLHAGEGEL